MDELMKSSESKGREEEIDREVKGSEMGGNGEKKGGGLGEMGNKEARIREGFGRETTPFR